MEGWPLFRHVHIGCFDIIFPTTYIEKSGTEVDDVACVKWCAAMGDDETQTIFHSQALFQQDGSSGLCRCIDPSVEQDDPFELVDLGVDECLEGSWHYYQEWDMRAHHQSLYDVARRLTYDVVIINVPQPIGTQTYIHARNPLERLPRFDFDTRIDRMLFNMAWDFGRSRLVGLSLEDWGSPLTYSSYSFDTFSGDLDVVATHVVIEDDIDGIGSVYSVDGMATIDILYNVYYTVVPTVHSVTEQYVHTILVMDIDTMEVKLTHELDFRLMNMQANNVDHSLYGSGIPSDDEAFSWFKLKKPIPKNISK